MIIMNLQDEYAISAKIALLTDNTSRMRVAGPNIH